ncbi:MAG: glucose-6-phosphate isomerase [Bryobacteraceae bacterium]|nr:glucose-6-phosphate isomerase [Bryobacteraceae bacterium]MDW8377438.1 glucose-6-phosphate isomerase [Bryobacterales bacterium]
MKIRFDATNLHAFMVGEHGLAPSEIKSNIPAAKAAIEQFQLAVKEGKYGFPELPFQTEEHREILAYAAQLQGSYDTVCLVGIGGSALGAWALDCALRGPHPVQKAFSVKNPRLVILDNVDPSFILAALESMNPRRTMVVVAAKSGATAETVAVFLHVKDWLTRSLGKKASQRIVAVTSEHRGDLKVLATQEGYRTFHLWENVGGRFSVLSAIGLVPAALAGMDIRKLAKGAAAITKLCWNRDLEKNVALKAALFHYLMLSYRNKTIQVAFPYSNRLWGVAFWFRQLWAESLGKRTNRAGEVIHAGQTPVAALGATDQHSQVQLYMEGPNDKVFTFWGVDKFPDPGRIPKIKTGLEAFDYLGGQTLAKLLTAERLSTAAALTAAHRPNCSFLLDRVDEEHVGAFLQIMEFETAFMGELLNINAFDQEGVELGKKFTFGLMGRRGFENFRDEFRAYEKKQQGR